MTQDEEDDFTRELAKMMVSTAETRKVPERKPVSLDVGLPMIRRNRLEVEEDLDGEEHPQKKGMQFTLLTKKGNKQQVSLVSIDSPHSSADLSFSNRRSQWRFLSILLSLKVRLYNENRTRRNKSSSNAWSLTTSLEKKPLTKLVGISVSSHE